MLRTGARAVSRCLNLTLHPWPAEPSPYKEDSVYKDITYKLQKPLLSRLSQNKCAAGAL